LNLRVATVKYLNALPFLNALKELEHQNQVVLTEAAPAECAKLLSNDLVDIALIPVAAISDFQKLVLVSNYCIACDGAVRTVKLFSNHPVESIQQIILDESSRTSNLLVQLLCKEYWKRSDIIFSKQENKTPDLKSGFVKIGDDVFKLENQHAYEYDLGEMWKLFTGLPFVFAIWVSKKSLNENQARLLNKSFQSNLKNIHSLITSNGLPKNINLNGYFDKNIYYELDGAKKSGLIKFIELANLGRGILDFSLDRIN
jgi:chorismate dehydratase